MDDELSSDGYQGLEGKYQARDRDQFCCVHGAGAIRPRAKDMRDAAAVTPSSTNVKRPLEKRRGSADDAPAFSRLSVVSEPSGSVTYACPSWNAILNVSLPHR